MSSQDLRFAARGLVRRPLAAAVAVGTLSLGLASVTALFAVVDAVILQPIGDGDSRLVRVWKDDVERGGGLLFPISYPEYLVWEEEATSFDALAAINYADGATVAVLVDGEPVTANRVLASAGLLDVVGARPVHGRLLEARRRRRGGRARRRRQPPFLAARERRPVIRRSAPQVPRRCAVHDRRGPAARRVLPGRRRHLAAAGSRVRPRHRRAPGQPGDPAVPRRGAPRAGRYDRSGTLGAGGRARAPERGASRGLPADGDRGDAAGSTPSSATFDPPSCSCWPAPGSCFSWRGRTSPSCCSCGPSRGASRWRCGRRWARLAGSSCGRP